jgi:hypothetical protein
MAMNSEAMVVGMSYARAMGSEKASMPMKCIDQIPLPIASAPPTSQSRDNVPCARATRAESRSAVCDTKMATATDRTTSQGLQMPAKVQMLREGHLGHASRTIGLIALRLEVHARAPVTGSANLLILRNKS